MLKDNTRLIVFLIITYFVFWGVSASKKQRVRFSNIMEVRQLPSAQALEAKLSRMSYPAAKDHEAMLRTVGKLTITDVAKISFFFCFVVSQKKPEPRGKERLQDVFWHPELRSISEEKKKF